jgi:hypothetical protein
MIIDSPIISGSYLSTGSLSQTGNVSITGSLTATAGITGSFSGSGANLFGIPASGITGLNLSQISSGSVSASISPNLGLLINTSVSASSFTGSFTGSLVGIATSASFAYTASSAVNASASLIAVSASYAATASYLLGYISPFPFTGSAQITGSLGVTGSINSTGNITAVGTITAQTLVVQTITSSIEYSSGSNIFGSQLTNTQTFTGSVNITGSAVNLKDGTFSGSGANLFGIPATGITGLNLSQIASGSASASISPNNGLVVNTNTKISGSAQITGSLGVTGSFSVSGSTGTLFSSNADTLLISGSLIVTGSTQITGSLSVSGSITGSLFGTASFALDAGTLTGTGSVGFATTASLNAVSSSQQSISASLLQVSASYIALSASYNTFSASNSTILTSVSSSLQQISASLLTVSRSYASTGSNTFVGTEIISGSLIVTGSNTVIGTKVVSGSVFITGSKAVVGTVTITGSLSVSGSTLLTGSLNVSGSLTLSTLATGSGVRYVIADQNGLLSAQTASAAIFTTQQNIASAGQTVFPITNGYVTDYLTVFVNGTKLANDEFTDNDGVNVTFLTGSTAGDTIEFVKYMPASGVSNNVLRTVNYFTASLGQTNFTVNYTPGLVDVFYNGAKLDNTEYTAANGTSILLATGSNAGDTLEVDVYSYQVGAFSGIGGVGVANQIAYYNTTNSITGSRNFTVSGSAIIITGSLIVSGSGTLINIGPAIFSGSVTSTAGFSGSFSGSFTGLANSSSLAQNALLLNATSSLIFATTGSNGFTANQSITGSLTVTGQITAQTLVVQTVTSSIVYSSGSNIFGNSLSNTQSFSGSSLFIGCVGIGTVTPSGSLHIYGSTYAGSRIYLERTSGAVGRYSMGVSTANNQFEITDEAQGNCTRLSITSAGNVLIGRTTSNNHKLEISGSATSALRIDVNSGVSAIAVGPGGEFNIDQPGIGGGAFKITSGGCVGIGTCAPNRLLDVRGDSYFYASNTAYSEGISVFANIGSTSGAGINFHCAPVGTVASATTLKAYLRVNQTGTCMILGTIAAGYDLCAMIVNIANGNVKFACNLTAATIGTNDLTLSNLNYESANYVDGTRGSWLIQEGACDLFIINQMSCKKYKFNLIEIE